MEITDIDEISLVMAHRELLNFGNGDLMEFIRDSEVTGVDILNKWRKNLCNPNSRYSPITSQYSPVDKMSLTDLERCGSIIKEK